MKSNLEKIDLVSIVLITYNHEKFIAEAIESIIRQKCSFKIELLIAEDCSTDNTREIVVAYAKKYPDIIKVLKRDKNMGATKNLYDAYMKCSGKYIAQLEGDDYWTDTEKLQKQYDFLEKNKEYICVTHLHGNINMKGEKIISKGWHGKPGRYTIKEFREENVMVGHTGTFFFRNFLKEDKEKYAIIYQAHDFMGDITLSFMLLLQGPIFCMEDEMSVQRIIKTKDGTNWGSVNNKRDLEYETIEYSMNLLQWEKKYYELEKSSINRMHKNVYLALAHLKNHPGKRSRDLLKMSFMQDVKKTEIIPFFIGMRWHKFKEKFRRVNNKR